MAGSATLVTDPSMKARLEASMVAVIVQRGWRSGLLRRLRLLAMTSGGADFEHDASVAARFRKSHTIWGELLVPQGNYVKFHLPFCINFQPSIGPQSRRFAAQGAGRSLSPSRP